MTAIATPFVGAAKSTGVESLSRPEVWKFQCLTDGLEHLSSARPVVEQVLGLCC